MLSECRRMSVALGEREVLPRWLRGTSIPCTESQRLCVTPSCSGKRFLALPAQSLRASGVLPLLAWVCSLAKWGSPCSARHKAVLLSMGMCLGMLAGPELATVKPFPPFCLSLNHCSDLGKYFWKITLIKGGRPGGGRAGLA